MLSDSDSDSDSSVDSKEKERLLEATVQNLLPSHVGPAKSHHGVKNPKAEPVGQKSGMHNRKSLRTSEKDQFRDDSCNQLNTSPEFKEFVAKKLSNFLDGNIEDQQEVKSPGETVKEDTGIRLFVTSSRLVKSEDDAPLETKHKQTRRKLSSSSDSSEEENRLAEAAVSHDFIIQQSRLSLPATSNDQESTSCVKDKLTNTKQSNDTTICSAIENNNSGERSHKKKKKKHKHNKEIKVS